MTTQSYQHNLDPLSRAGGSPTDVSRTDTSAVAARPRLHGLDALRGGALLLGILLHALMPFDTTDSWAVSDSQQSALAHPIIIAIHLFRMALFMALAGYFGAMVLQRRGAVRYVRERTTRILLPAIAFWPVVMIGMGLVIHLRSALRDLPAPSAGGNLLSVLLMPGILWFLWTLMECALIVVVIREVLVRTVDADRLSRLGAAVGRWLTAPGGVLLAAVPYAAGLAIQGSLGGGINAPLTIMPELSSLIPYLGAFIVGWLFFIHQLSLPRLAEQWLPHLLAAIALTLAAYPASLGMIPLPIGVIVTAVAGWAWVYALIGLCMRYLQRERPAVRYLADASYWAYLLHMPILLLCAVLLADLPLPAIVKLVASLAVTGVFLLLSYHLLVRSTVIGQWLNGRRHLFRWNPIASASVSAAGEIQSAVVTDGEPSSTA